MAIIILLFILCGLLGYLMILGGNKSKTEEERRLEDEEQMEWLRNYKKGGK